MQTFLILFFLLIFLFYGYLIYKGISFTANEHLFKQAGVIVNFKDGTITIKGKPYKASQVTGIRMSAFESTHKYGESSAKNVFISLDDFNKPQHKILFISNGHARKFMQRLATAIRKAGGRDFI